MRDERDMLYNPPPGGFTAEREYRPSAPRPDKPREPNMMRMGLIAGGIAVMALGVMSLWSWAGHRHSGVPVIEADSRPVREKPADQGGMKVEGANEAILSGNTDSRAVVTPAPETPALAALRSAATAPPPAAAPAPQQMTALAPAAEENMRVSGLGETPGRPLLNASPPAAAEAPTPAPVAKPAPRVAANSLPQPAKPAVKSVPSGKAMVQLAAVKSEAAANSEWVRLEHKFPALLGGRDRNIVAAERAGKSFWRLRVVGFADKKSAGEFCGKLKAAGGQCTLSAG